MKASNTRLGWIRTLYQNVEQRALTARFRNWLTDLPNTAQLAKQIELYRLHLAFDLSEKREAGEAMDLLLKAIDKQRFLLDVSANDFKSVARQAVGFAAEKGILAAGDVESITSGFVEREKTAPTAIGDAVAIPHLYDNRIAQQAIIFVRLERGMNLGAPDGTPTRFFWFLCGPQASASAHLDALAEIARLTSDDEFIYEIGKARNQTQMVAAIQNVLDRTLKPVVAKPVAETDSRFSWIPFKGVGEDLAQRSPFYKSDFVDGLNMKSVSSIFFLFFACLAPAITFGGICALETDNQIGVIEMILASLICGVVYALFAGQPLIILGGTGPLLIFTIVLYQLCRDYSISFLETYAWVGIWTAVLVILMAVFNVSTLIYWFTRFTDEIFATLISLIFIYKAVHHLFVGAQKGLASFHEGGGFEHLAIALLAILLALGTFYIAMALARIRHSRFLSPTAREFLADFGPSIAVFAMAIIAVTCFDGIDFKRLNISAELVPSMIDPETEKPRPWLLNIFVVETWVIFVTIIPAFLLSLLVYADQNITARLVNSRDHHLKKGEAYHWDLGVVGLLIGVCSIFGLPWLVAATVRSLNHVRSLAKLENEVTPSGETRERVIHVQETRVAAFVIHALIGVSLLFADQFKYVPTAVLYGLFLFMGVVSLSGNQFFTRLTLWFTDRSLYPSTHYVRKVPKLTMHLFTLIQVLSLGLLWFVKESQFGLFFPLFIVMLVPIRMMLNRFFDSDHLAALDAEEEPAEEEDQWS